MEEVEERKRRKERRKEGKGSRRRRRWERGRRRIGLFFFLFPYSGTQKSHKHTYRAGTTILDFPISRTVKINLCYLSHP